MVSNQTMEKYQDLRGKDLSNQDLSDTAIEILISSKFNTLTKWSPTDKLPNGFIPNLIIEKGKCPGLGIENIQENGITGKGINVAIIDQKLLKGHVEYRDVLASYEEIGEQNYGPQMHGSAVASLLVGKDCGVAPEAKLFYYAVPCHRNFTCYAIALKQIIEHNRASIDKIRAVSCSIGYREEIPEEGLDGWIETIIQAEKEGIIMVHCAMRQLNLTGCGSRDDKDNLTSYRTALYTENHNNKINISVPVDYRTYASCGGEKEYEYSAKGGLSWAMPYVTGLICLILQVNPYSTNEEVFGLIRNNYSISQSGIKIINPSLIIESIQKLVKN